VPHGRTTTRGGRDKGAWNDPPRTAQQAWSGLEKDFKRLCELHPRLKNTNNLNHLGTLGTGNHFVEICLDESDQVWVMLHSGSRGVGNAIGTHFIELAQADMRGHVANLPHRDLAYFQEGSPHFKDYVFAVDWAQRFARENRAIMMSNTLAALAKAVPKRFTLTEEAVNCHHNYVQREEHYGESLFVTRKGAVSARKGQLGIIPGSMGARSFIVRGLGNEESLCSCSHGAGRVMSRTKAKQLISLEAHRQATAHVECRKDEAVIDESPAAYKPIDQVMEAQRDLVEIVHTLRQVVCVKG
jgi:tRNA-splicing ligase RtcB